VAVQVDLQAVLGPHLGEVLQHLDEAMIVLDPERRICYANHRAVRLLGYQRGEAVGRRCRLTTRGVDCESACPLTYALEGKLDRVDGFDTVYRTREGHPVPLNVTVIPLRDEHGGFCGAVEILRPTEPDPGFFLAGDSPPAREARALVRRLADERRHVLLVGDPVGRGDVARTLHRYSGLSDELFRSWSGSWDRIAPFPPGTAYADGEGARSLLGSSPPAGWRLVAGVCESDPELVNGSAALEVVELPALDERPDDVPLVVAAWIRQLAPRLAVAPRALEKLCRLTRDVGLRGVRPTLARAVASAADVLEEEHVPGDGYRLELVDEALRSERPLVALEERVLREVLERCCWRVQEAADRLGMSRVTLWRKMKEHGIERPNGG